MHVRVGIAILVAVAWLELAAARPDFAAADERRPSVLRRRGQPVSADEPRPFKQTVRDVEDSGGKVYNGLQAYPRWGEDPSVSSCALSATWDAIINRHRNGTGAAFRIGGLGTLSEPPTFEVWVCEEQHWCANGTSPFFCFAYHEVNEVFVPWGPNSLLGLVQQEAPTPQTTPQIDECANPCDIGTTCVEGSCQDCLPAWTSQQGAVGLQGCDTPCTSGMLSDSSTRCTGMWVVSIKSGSSLGSCNEMCATQSKTCHAPSLTHVNSSTLMLNLVRALGVVCTAGSCTNCAEPADGPNIYYQPGGNNWGRQVAGNQNPTTGHYTYHNRGGCNYGGEGDCATKDWDAHRMCACT